MRLLTEGRGSNAGTCLINLKDWSKRKKSVQQIIEELEENHQKTLVRLWSFLSHPLYPVMALLLA